MSRILLALALLFSCASAAHGWGREGHRLVADIAEAQLSPSARAEVARLLDGEPEPTLAGVSTWADIIRGEPAWKWTAPMHYVKLDDVRCEYSAQRGCRDGLCVVGAIAFYSRILADHAQPDGARRDALKFLVHFIGDVHQPLHAGHRPDRGGNDFQVNINGEGSNLHAVWDGRLLRPEMLRQKAPSGSAANAKPAQVPAQSAAVWASDSCRLTDTAGFYPPRPGRLPPDYLQRFESLATEQAALAGTRLAWKLNSLLTVDQRSD